MGHMKLEFLQKYPFTLKQDRILKKYQPVKQFKVLILTTEDWCMPGKITNPNADLWFMDESVFMDQGITRGEAVLWTASLQCFKLR